MSHSLAAYVPVLATELGETPGSHHREIDGSMLSADISGFTALSERLAGKGKAGAEEITELINLCFTALIDAAYWYGGEVLKFGGDAILVLFRGDDHRVRAGTAALAMQEALRATAAARRAELSMTVGVAEGPFDAFLVGVGRRELLISGARSTEVIRLEAASAKGGTLMSRSVAEALALQLADVDGGGLVLADHTPTERPEAVVDLAPFLPASVRDQLAALQSLGGEHRLVTVGFVMVEGIDEMLAEHGPAATTTALSDLVDRVDAACAQYSVTMLHSDIAPSGAKLILAAGAPLTSGTDEDGMLLAALEIAAADTPLRVRIGVQRGRVFAGFLGAAHRRTYTVMGDPVNTAARLLGQAEPGQVIAADAVISATRVIFEIDTLPPFMVKGKSEPLLAHRVIADTDQTRATGELLPLLGRDTELAELVQAIRSSAQAVVISGPTGHGKTRLVDEAFGALPDRQPLLTACSPYGTTLAYGVIRRLLKRIIGLKPTSPADETGRRLAYVVHDRAPELAPMLPLIAMPFGARVDDTATADAIADEHRRRASHEATLELLDRILEDADVIGVDDTQWLDEASADIVERLAERSGDRPWSVIVTHRDDSTWTLSGDVARIELAPLEAATVRRLAIDASLVELPDASLDQIVERADGNPMFAIEIARSTTSTDSTALPDSLESALGRRLDDLAPELRQAVRVAAVFGPRFDDDDVRAVVDGAGPSRSEFLDSGLFQETGGGRLAFRQGFYREVAYEGLPFARRKRIHARVAEHLASKADPDPAELSVHYSAAGAHREAWEAGREAGQRAAAAGAHREAAAAYERALAASRYHRAGDHERRDVATALADSLAVIGEFDAARSALDTARRLNDEPLHDVDLIRRIGTIHERSGRTKSALAAFRRARRSLPDPATTPEQLVARARAMLGEAGVVHRRGDYAACRDLAAAALDDARSAGDVATEAAALDRIHVSTTFLREPDPDRLGEQALALFRQLDDAGSQARVLNNLGAQAYFDGDWTAASKYYDEAAAAAQRTGDVVFAGTAALNRAEVLSDQGHWTDAIMTLEELRRNWDALGYRTGSAVATMYLGIARTRRGDLDAADRDLRAAEASLRELELAEYVAETHVRQLELDVRRRTISDEQLAQAARDHRGREVLLDRLRAAMLVGRGELGEAADLARRVVETLPADSYARAQAIEVLAAATELPADLADERRSTWERLGIVALAVLPA